MHQPTYQKNHLATDAFSYGGRIVCGTSGLGGVWGEINPDESVAAILYALTHGVRAFDTAPSYANAERYLGMALAEWHGEKPFISTKVGRQRGEDAFDFKLDYTNAALEKSLHQSLKTLGVEMIDLLFLHEPQLAPVEEMDRIITCLHRFKEQGLIRYVGVGGNPNATFYPFIKKKNFDVVSGFLKLDACNLSALEKDIPLFQSEHIAYYAASPLHFALLGERLEAYKKSGADDTWITKKDITNALEVEKLAASVGMPISTVAQRYLFAITEADRIVVGPKNLEQMKATLDDWEAGALPVSLFNAVTHIILKKP